RQPEYRRGQLLSRRATPIRAISRNFSAQKPAFLQGTIFLPLDHQRQSAFPLISFFSVSTNITPVKQDSVRRLCRGEVTSFEHSKTEKGISKMQKRKRGKSNLEVSAIDLGCMGMSFSGGRPKGQTEMG